MLAAIAPLPLLLRISDIFAPTFESGHSSTSHHRVQLFSERFPPAVGNYIGIIFTLLV